MLNTATSTDSYNFFANGFIHGHVPDFNRFDFAEFDFLDCEKNREILDQQPVIDSKAIDVLDEVFSFLATAYIQPLFDEFQLLESSMWQGVDHLSATWHNDYIKGKTFNSNILVYIDDNTPENGNFIEVRNQIESFLLYPKSGDFVWLNQKDIFQHKATRTSGIRRLMCYELMIPALL